MNKPINNVFLQACLLLTLCGGVPAQGSDSAESLQAKARLAALRDHIAGLTARLGTDLAARDALNARLREMDLSLTAGRLRLDGLRSARATAARHQTVLREEQATIEKTLVAQRHALAEEARNAYMLGSQEQLKLVLNQSDPAAVGRLLSYYSYFVHERAGKIAGIRAQVERDRTLVDEIARATAALETLEHAASEALTQLHQARAERSTALRAVLRQVSSGDDELARLKREEQALEALVADLAQVLQEFPVDTQQRFETLRGRLAWPVAGRIGAHGGEPRGFSGVRIDASPGAKVRAPYYGRVVYADWLQGLGLLLIIGHGDNYMTLYGHAEVLYKSVGEWVAPGDVIAGMSDAAGATPQLYFEIRDGRRTVDARAWLKEVP